MPEIYIDHDEWYPVFYLEDRADLAEWTVIVTEEQMDRIQRAFVEFEEVQTILREAVDKADKAKELKLIA